MSDKATVTKTDLIIAPSRIAAEDGTIYRLEGDYENHAGDWFMKDEALVMTSTGVLTRLGAAIGDPAIANFEVVE